MTSWHDLLNDSFQKNNDRWENVEFCALSSKELNDRFDCGFGGDQKHPFTLWTKDYVYFPIGFDGCSEVGSAPRNPSNIKTDLRC